MAKAVLMLDERRAKKDGSYPVIIRLTHKTKVLPIKTGYDGIPIKNTFKVIGHDAGVKLELQEQENDINKFLRENKDILDELSIEKVRQLAWSVKRGGNNVSALTLAEGIEKYIAYLRNEDVPQHLQRQRTDQHVVDVERALRFLAKTLGKDILIQGVSPEQVGLFYQAVKNKNGRQGAKLKARRYNFYMQSCKTFFDWLHKRYGIQNHFSEVELKQLAPKAPMMLTLEEFNQVLNAIDQDPEGAEETFYKSSKDKQKKRKVRYHGKPWMKNAIKLALYGGGRRREELVKLRWSDVIPNEVTGSLTGGILRYRNLKVERQKNVEFADEQLAIEIPIPEQLATLLHEMGYPGKPSQYILAPESESRADIMEALSRGFSFYYERIPNPRPGISFKNIRKTYITFIRAVLGSQAKTVTGHSTDAIIERHYEDPALIRERVVEKLKF